VGVDKERRDYDFIGKLEGPFELAICTHHMTLDALGQHILVARSISASTGTDLLLTGPCNLLGRPWHPHHCATPVVIERHARSTICAETFQHAVYVGTASSQRLAQRRHPLPQRAFSILRFVDSTASLGKFICAITPLCSFAVPFESWSGYIPGDRCIRPPL